MEAWEEERKGLVVELLSRDERTLEVSIEGEGHTLLNLLVDELNRNPHVTMAAYSIDHPLIGRARLIIRTDGKVAPEDALREATENLQRILGEIREQLAKEVSKLAGGKEASQ